MATIIYNHREMEYNCKKYWKNNIPIFEKSIHEAEIMERPLIEEVNKLSCYEFDEDYAMDYGMDTLRLYVLFEKYPKCEEEYLEGSLEGIYKFLNRLMTLVFNSVNESATIMHNERKILRKIEKTDQKDANMIKVMEEKRDIFLEEIRQALVHNNTHSIVAAFMEYCTNLTHISLKYDICILDDLLKEMIIMLSPFAPFMSEFLWNKINKDSSSVFEQKYPYINRGEQPKNHTVDMVAIQVDGKTKKVIPVRCGISEEEVKKQVMEEMGERMPSTIVKVVYVPAKIFNMITLHKKSKE